MVIQKSGRQCGQRRHNRESREDTAPAIGYRQAGNGVSGKHTAQIADPIDDAGGGRAGFASAHVQGNGFGQIGIWTEQEEGHQANENHCRRTQQVDPQQPNRRDLLQLRAGFHALPVALDLRQDQAPDRFCRTRPASAPASPAAPPTPQARARSASSPRDVAGTPHPSEPAPRSAPLRSEPCR